MRFKIKLKESTKNFYRAKKVLVTGGTGMIGIPLVEMLIDAGAKVRVASLDDPSRAHPESEFVRADLRSLDNCMKVCEGMDFAIQMAGIKGSPKMMIEKPASCLVPQLLFNTSMMEAAFRCGLERYLFTSTIGVYAPAEVFNEDDVWSSMPSDNDKFGGWGKRIGELQAEAYRIEHKWDKISIVRPANVYGPFDNFDPANAMVVPSLIRRVLDGEKPLTVWGDGSNIRDIVHAADVAHGALLMMEQGVNIPVNLGSGTGVTVKQVAEIVVAAVDPSIEIKWDITKPTGDRKRLMNIKRAESYGWTPQISLKDGIEETIEWFKENRLTADKRHNPFK